MPLVDEKKTFFTFSRAMTVPVVGSKFVHPRELNLCLSRKNKENMLFMQYFFVQNLKKTGGNQKAKKYQKINHLKARDVYRKIQINLNPEGEPNTRHVATAESAPGGVLAAHPK